MSSTAPLHPQCALDTLERMQHENIDLATAIFRATMRFMRAWGFPASEDLWVETAETIVRQAHSNYSVEIGHTLWNIARHIHEKDGMIGLIRRAEAAVAQKRDMTRAFNDFLDDSLERIVQLTPAQRQLFYDTLPQLKASLAPSEEAEADVLQFIRSKSDHIRFLDFMHENFHELTAPLRRVRRHLIIFHAEEALKIIRPLLYKPFTLLYETLEEGDSVAAQLRALNDGPLRDDDFARMVSGMTTIRAKLIELRESSDGLLHEFVGALHTPIALATTLGVNADGGFGIEELLDAARFYLQADGLLARTHQFDETRALMDMLRREASWTA
ncbi:hypothetical protein FKP32DRAFT_1672384 [Trametes sanguinea]|nr:hypothetical protein FKP32DRAFT_1672384 [Trametes sanguinea]